MMILQIVKPPARTRGAALFISLVFLVILTLIGISSANVGVLQERMAGNVRESNEAFQAAEATLREIERELRNIISGGAGGSLGSIPNWADVQSSLGISRNDCTLSGANTDNWPWQTAQATGNDYIVIALTDAGPGGSLFGSACRPLNEGGDTPLDEFYLVAARANGPAGVGEVVVQSIFYWPG